MSSRKIKDRNIRKISRIGNHSLGVTLPVEFLVALGWREKQNVVISRKGAKLVISDWKPKKKK